MGIFPKEGRVIELEAEFPRILFGNLSARGAQWVISHVLEIKKIIIYIKVGLPTVCVWGGTLGHHVTGITQKDSYT